MDTPVPTEQAEQTAQRFLGLRMRCAQCHDHPFDVWTQDDYLRLRRLLRQGLSAAAVPGMMMMDRIKITINPKGQVVHLRTEAAGRGRGCSTARS